MGGTVLKEVVAEGFQRTSRLQDSPIQEEALCQLPDFTPSLSQILQLGQFTKWAMFMFAGIPEADVT